MKELWLTVLSNPGLFAQLTHFEFHPFRPIVSRVGIKVCLVEYNSPIHLLHIESNRVVYFWVSPGRCSRWSAHGRWDRYDVRLSSYVGELLEARGLVSVLEDELANEANTSSGG